MGKLISTGTGKYQLLMLQPDFFGLWQECIMLNCLACSEGGEDRYIDTVIRKILHLLECNLWLNVIYLIKHFKTTGLILWLI